MDRKVGLFGKIAPSPKGRLQQFLDVVVLRSWWVFLFAAGAYLLFAQGMHKKKEAHREITERLHLLEKEKELVLEEKEDLLLQINSQNDPAYIQMVLMKKLGVVPEGQTKVHFQQTDEN